MTYVHVYRCMWACSKQLWFLADIYTSNNLLQIPDETLVVRQLERILNPTLQLYKDEWNNFSSIKNSTYCPLSNAR